MGRDLRRGLSVQLPLILIYVPFQQNGNLIAAIYTNVWYIHEMGHYELLACGGGTGGAAGRQSKLILELEAAAEMALADYGDAGFGGDFANDLGRDVMFAGNGRDLRSFGFVDN